MTKLDSKTKRLIPAPIQRRAWVKFRLQIQGRSVAAVARGAGVDRRTLYRAFRQPYLRMEKAIADALGLTPQELFPEHYNKDGLPNRIMGRKPIKSTVTALKINTKPKPRHVQSEGGVRDV